MGTSKLKCVIPTPRCSTCGETEPTRFTKNRSRPTGLSNYCKTCQSKHVSKNGEGGGEVPWLKPNIRRRLQPDRRYGGWYDEPRDDES
jgi:hypothetical protein